MPYEFLTVRVPPELKQRVAEEAKRLDRSLNKTVSLLLRERLEELEAERAVGEERGCWQSPGAPR